MPISELNVWTILIEQIKAWRDGNDNMLLIYEFVSDFFIYSCKD